MKRVLAAVGLALIAVLPAVPAAAQSQGWVTTNVNMRSGPGTEYPPVLVVPAGAPVQVFGCIEGYVWCDVGFNEARGFVAGSLISYEYQNVRRPVVEIGPQIALPIMAFALGSYWDNHYRGRSFYRDRDRWDRRYVSAPRPGYRPPPAYRPPPRAVYHRPDYRPDYRPDRRIDDRRRFDNDRRREYRQERPAFRPDRPDNRQEFRRQVERRQEQPRFDRRPDHRQDQGRPSRGPGSGHPRPPAADWKSRGPMAGE
ncbi:uncharacterized protein YraI [Stella humosa]|uniref:Uncharacterized protein YraI n=1 Tax=Stella humosa TaxID=94 RepID=A0A3N1L287_9PROT|nr:SH3 domain-containing protein [Stella humosa]ROP83635.1 uncharacterized protein YraI [Stella humosa]